MSFTELEFAFFLPAVLVAYWLLPRRAALQNGALLAASYLFYASWNVRLLPLLVLSTAVDFCVARYLDAVRHAEGAESRDGARARRRMRAALALSLGVNLGALAWFKYAGFFAESLAALLATAGLPHAFPTLRIVLPLGISFYTLQKLGYVLDVYQGRERAERSPLVFATFAAFFPQITAGPISRAASLLPQLRAPRRPLAAQAAAGVGAFFLGFTLKAYGADLLGEMLVTPVFGDPARFSVASRWLALLAYAAQIFCDFAGYSLLAIGVARLVGIELPVNFNFPFVSRSLPEFWRRWHITLNAWLFDYVYGPLTTGPMRGRLDAGLIVVFLASGLWHGAGATFLLWGLLHGVGMVAHRRWDDFYRGLCRRDRAWVARRKTRGYVMTAWALTQLFFVLTLVPFGAGSVGEALAYARGLVGESGAEFVGFGVHASVTLLLLVVYHLLGAGRVAAWRERFVALPAPLRGAAYGLAVVWLLLFVPVGASAFIYRQF